MADNLELSLFEIHKLLAAASGDAALLYLHLAAGEPLSAAQERLRMTEGRFELACATLRQLGLWKEETVRHLEPAEAPVYTEEDLAREYAASPEFPAMVGDAQRRLGRVLSTDELKILLSMYRYLGLAPEVISILINYCIQRGKSRGNLRPPSIRSIEKEAYKWADAGIDTMEEAGAYVQLQLQLQTRVGQIRQILGIADQKLTPGEEKMVLSWIDWGFDGDVIEKAFEKTHLNTGGLKWPYLHSILKSWHEQGFTTLRQIEAGDRQPAAPSGRKKPGYNVQHHGDALSELERAAIEKMMREEE